MHLLTLDDLKEIAQWPQYKEEKLSWANFTYITHQEQKYWFNTNMGNHSFWLSLFVLSHYTTNKGLLREKAHALSKGIVDRTALQTSPNKRSLIGRISTLVPEKQDELIFGIAIHPHFLELGLGTLATQMYLFATFELTTVDSVWLETQETNFRAQHVYEKIGFKRLGYHYKTNTFGIQEKRVSYVFPRESKERLPKVFEII